MKAKFFKSSICIFAAIAVSAPIYAEQRSVYASLDCSAKLAVSSQPCGGENYREMNLKLYYLDGKLVGGLTDRQDYNGCYPVSSNRFGKLTAIELQGDKVLLTVKMVGYAGRVPVFVQEEEGSEMQIELNQQTNKITVVNDERQRGWIKYPQLLKCRSSNW